MSKCFRYLINLFFVFLCVLIEFNSFRFKTYLAKEIIQEILLKYLKDKEYNQINAEILSKTIASEVKDKLKGFIYCIYYRTICIYYFVIFNRKKHF